MGGDRPKVLADLLGRPLIHWVLDAALALDPAEVLVVVGYRREEVEHYLGEHFDPAIVRTVEQAEQHGTGHAVQVCAPLVTDRETDVLILYGDSPRVTTRTLERLADEHRETGAGVTVLVGRMADPTGYGRILRDEAGRFAGIREQADATPQEQAIDEVNPGYYCFRGADLWPALERVGCDNAQGEYYLTDAVIEVAHGGGSVETLTIEEMAELQGVNSLLDLSARRREALAERILVLQSAGVDVIAPEAVYLEVNVEIGSGSRVWPGVVVREGCRAGANCELGPGVVLSSGSRLGDGVRVGAHAVLDGSVVGDGAEIAAGTRLSGVEIEAQARVGVD